MWFIRREDAGGSPRGVLRRAAVVFAAGLALALNGVLGASAASASGTVQSSPALLIHGTPSSGGVEDLTVQSFYVVGSGFKTAERVALAFAVQPGDGPTGVLPDPNWFGPYIAQDTGDGRFLSRWFIPGDVMLEPGHYQAIAYVKNTDGAWVEVVRSHIFKVIGFDTTDTGTVTLTKALADTSKPAGDLKFPISISCSGTAMYTHMVKLAVGESWTTVPLPAGTTCQVGEATPTGWDYVPTINVTVIKDKDVPVTVVNNLPKTPAGLAITKATSPAGAVKPGGLITYTLTVVSTGGGANPYVTVYDSLAENQGFYTYVAGSGTCSPAKCTVKRQVDVIGHWWGSWLEITLGRMVPGQVIQVTFQVRVAKTVPAGTVIHNQAAAAQQFEGSRDFVSNTVANPIVAVLAEKQSQPTPTQTSGEELAASGSTTPAAPATALGVGLVVAGLTLLALSRKRHDRAS